MLALALQSRYLRSEAVHLSQIALNPYTLYATDGFRVLVDKKVHAPLSSIHPTIESYNRHY